MILGYIHVALSVYVSFWDATENVINICLQKVCPAEVMKKQIWWKECFKNVSLLYSVTSVFIADEEYEDGIERTHTLLMCIVTVLNQGLRMVESGLLAEKTIEDVSCRKIVFHGAHSLFF